MARKENDLGDELTSFFTVFGELGVGAFWTRARLGDALLVVERELQRRTEGSGLTLEGLPLCCPLCSVRVWCEDAGEGRTILVNENGAPHADTCGFERERADAEGEEEEDDETQ